MSNRNKTMNKLGTDAVIRLTTMLTTNQFPPIRMENYGDVNDTGSQSALATIKEELRAGGFAALLPKRTKVTMPGDHLRPLRFEDATVEHGSHETNDGTDNEAFLTEAQEKAGIIAAAQAEDPYNYAKKTAEQIEEANKTNNTGLDASYVPRLAMEAYSDANFRDAVGFSTIWNIVAARQSNAVENIWQTITLDQDLTHIEALVQFQTFQQELRHKSTGDAANLDRILLLETLIDGSLLDENIIKCVPVLIPGVSEKHFAAAADIAPRTVIVEGESVVTAPLLAGVEHGILGLSQAAIANLTGELNTASQLAPMPAIETLYVRITNKAAVKSIIAIPAANLARSTFTGSLEGNIQEVSLNMRLAAIGLDANTVDVNGVPALALATLRNPAYLNHRVEFSLNVFGGGNLETGNIDIPKAEGKVSAVKIKQSFGQFSVEKDADIVEALTDDITSIEFVWFDLDVKRTNIDRLQRGPLTLVTSQIEKYYVRQGGPISTIFPAIDAVSNVDLVAPMTATRAKNDYYGIRALFAAGEVLASQAISNDSRLARGDMRAIGRYIVKPYFRHYTISMLDILDSNRSKNKLEDAQHAILNYVRDAVIHAMRDSNYELALQVQTGSSEAVPTLAILTNQILGKYLWQSGDTRILGSLPYPTVAGTHVSNLLGTYGSDTHEMFIVPTLPGTQGNPLNFGYHLWKAESASTLEVTRGNSTSREIVVQPCNDWHMFCPVALRFTITDLTHAMTSKTALMVSV